METELQQTKKYGGSMLLHIVTVFRGHGETEEFQSAVYSSEEKAIAALQEVEDLEDDTITGISRYAALLDPKSFEDEPRETHITSEETN